MLAQVSAHLRAAAGNPFIEIGTALSLAAAQDNPPQRDPVAWVYPSAAAGESSGRVNATRQRITTRIGVVFYLRPRANDPGGGKSADPIERLYTWLRGALIGWVPDPATGNPMEFQRGYLAGLDEGGVFWAEEYAIDHYHRL
jgi:hypothetical protein